MGLTFEWDTRKAASNLKKHAVSFEEAATAFADQLSLTIADPDHSEDEERFLLVGLSHRAHLVVVAHTESGERIRIISARLASVLERKSYEKG
jgi:uncharacterized protein